MVMASKDRTDAGPSGPARARSAGAFPKERTKAHARSQERGMEGQCIRPENERGRRKPREGEVTRPL